VRFAAFHHFLAVSIECVVDDPLGGILFVVILEAEMPESFSHGFETGPLRLMVKRIVGVGAVDDATEQYKCWIGGQLVFLQNRFERTFLAVVAELDNVNSLAQLANLNASDFSFI